MQKCRYFSSFFEKLEKLNLDGNAIKNKIEFLENFNCKELKELYISNNDIYIITVLDKVKFEKLQKLYFKWNKISNNLYNLKNVNFKDLKE